MIAVIVAALALFGLGLFAILNGGSVGVGVVLMMAGIGVGLIYAVTAGRRGSPT